MANIKETLPSTLNREEMSAEEFLTLLVYDFLNEEEIIFDEDNLFKDEELLPVFLDWLCENINLREDYELVAIIERDSGYTYIIEAGGNQAFI